MDILRDLPMPAVIAYCTLLITALWGVLRILSWVLSDWWSEKKKVEESNKDALQQNTLAIVELRTEVRHLNQFLHVIPKIQSEVELAHKLIRDLQND